MGYTQTSPRARLVRRASELVPMLKATRADMGRVCQLAKKAADIERNVQTVTLHTFCTRTPTSNCTTGSFATSSRTGSASDPRIPRRWFG